MFHFHRYKFHGVYYKNYHEDNICVLEIIEIYKCKKCNKVKYNTIKTFKDTNELLNFTRLKNFKSWGCKHISEFKKE